MILLSGSWAFRRIALRLIQIEAIAESAGHVLQYPIACSGGG
jgi:hypothetical protein